MMGYYLEVSFTYDLHMPLAYIYSNSHLYMDQQTQTSGPRPPRPPRPRVWLSTRSNINPAGGRGGQGIVFSWQYINYRIFVLN